MLRIARRFREDQRGNIAIMSAVTMVMLCGFAALGVDVGTVFADRRKVQSAADLAAIVAASNISNAANAARATVTSNGLSADALSAVELGVYKPDASIGPQSRFVLGGASPNAARITLRTKTPLFFGRLLTGTDNFDVQASATASSTQVASFAIGSRLAALNGGIVNSLLGTLLGTSLSLSVMDYQALLNAKVDLLDFINALAIKANLTAGNYEQVLAANLKLPEVVNALLSVQKLVGGVNQATTALTNISLALAGITTTVQAGELIDLGPYEQLPVGQKPKVNVSASVLDILSAIAQVANGANQVAAGANVGLPGIAGVTLMVTIGEKPVNAEGFVVGPNGTSAHTAQTRVYLNVQLLGSGSVSAVNLPIYVEVAPGTAVLDSVSCAFPDTARSSATLAVTPGIVDAWIGTISSSAMTNFKTKPVATTATLVDLGLVKVTGLAHAGMGNTTPVRTTFSPADIQALTKKTVTTTNFTQSLVGSLLGDLELTVVVGPLGVPLGGLTGLVAGILAGATPALDQLLNAVLGLLGVGLGQADVWVSGVRCDGAVLVH